MIGKEFNDKLLEDSITVLMNEFKLPEKVPGGMSKYRLSLTMGFFYKFFINTKGNFSFHKRFVIQKCF
jgi:hypothetical protein